MTTYTLFNDIRRTDTNRADHTHSSYKFLNESAWESFRYIRSLLQDWAVHYPLSQEFIRRFRSDDNQMHRGAFFELFMFTLLRKLGYEIDVHRKPNPEAIKIPDFYAFKEGISQFYLECSLSSNPLEDLSIVKIQSQINDTIERIQSPNFWICTNCLKCTTQFPSLKAITNFITTKLREVPSQVINRPPEFAKWLFQNNGWEIEFSLVEKSQKTKEKAESRSLGFISYGAAQMVNSENPLVTALKDKKGSHYGNLKDPFLIALNSYDITLDEISIKNALYGYNTGDKIQTPLVHSDGFFMNKNSRVSGVTIVNGLVPWNMHKAKAQLWLNPFAKNAFGNELNGIEKHLFVPNASGDYRKTKIVGKDVTEILNIDSNKMD